jgi:hypothetical protein
MNKRKSYIFGFKMAMLAFSRFPIDSVTVSSLDEYFMQIKEYENYLNKSYHCKMSNNYMKGFDAGMRFAFKHYLYRKEEQKQASFKRYLDVLFNYTHSTGQQELPGDVL